MQMVAQPSHGQAQPAHAGHEHQVAAPGNGAIKREEGIDVKREGGCHTERQQITQRLIQLKPCPEHEKQLPMDHRIGDTDQRVAGESFPESSHVSVLCGYAKQATTAQRRLLSTLTGTPQAQLRHSAIPSLCNCLQIPPTCARPTCGDARAHLSSFNYLFKSPLPC